MLKRLLLVIIVASASITSAFAQKSAVYSNSNKDYDNAIMLYNNKQYAPAQLEFEKLLNNSNYNVTENAEFYYSLCSIKLGEKNGDYNMQQFVGNYPTSIKKNKAIIEMANYYYDSGKYSKAYVWYNKIDVYDLNGSDKDEFIFRKAYTEYSSKKYDKAKLNFSKILSSRSYGVDANYYYAHISYLQEQNETALKYFEKVEDEKKYKDQVPFFISQIYFNQKKYDKVIEVSKPLLKDKKNKYFSDLSKVVGESYFNKEDYENALENLLNYKGVKGKFTNTHLYQIGYSYYKIEKYENSISYFNKIINEKSEVAQNAYYNLAACYLKLNKKNEALNAFRSASEMEFDDKIAEDALYNYAKLSYEVGNVAETAPQALNRYLKKHSESYHKKEIYKLMVDSYLKSNNYKEVISILDSTGLNSYKMKVVYQKSTYFLAIQYFNDDKYGEAQENFQKSLDGGYDAIFRAKAKYWIGESNYRLGNFDEALVNFKSFRLEDYTANSTEGKMLPYNIGYTQFKLKNYTEALTEFNAFSKQNIEDVNIKNDTYLRLGDSYFMNTKYWPALENYNKSLDLKVGEGDYATYQKAVCYGLLGRNNQRIETLNLLVKNYPNSKLGDDALYLLGTSYVRESNNDMALKSFTEIEKKYPGSSYVSKSKLKKALIYYNSSKNKQALKEYKEVVDKYPSTTEAKQAVSGSKKIYIDMGKANDYVAWVKTLDFIDITKAEADSTTYLAAESAFMKNNCNLAIPAFRSYLNDYPKGIAKLNAHFYLAQCEYKSGMYDEALKNYQEVINKEKNEFTERSLVRASELYVNNKDTVNAIISFEKLLVVAEFNQNKTYADINLMEIYNAQNNLDKALEHAALIMINAKVSDRVKSKAQLIIARGAMKKGDLDLAKQSYQKLMISAKGEVKAEAKYYNAFFLNADGKYEESNKEIFEIAAKFAAYKYWGGKSLLIMADNFDKLNDQYQAVYTLETVVNNFGDYKEIITKAKEMMQEIKKKTDTVNTDSDTTKTN